VNKIKIMIISIITVIFLFSISCREPSVQLNPVLDQQISSFTLDRSDNPDLVGDIEAEIKGSIVYFSLADGTVRDALIPSFKVSGKGLQVNGEWQKSGSTVQDFSAPVYYDLIRTDNSRVQYSVVAGYGENNSKSLDSFGFQTALNANLSSSVYGIIKDDIIEFDFPFEDSVLPMIPSFSTPGIAVVSYNGVNLNDGAAPLMNPANGGSIRVDFDDGSTKVYTVKANTEIQKYIYVSTSGSGGASGSQSDPFNTIEEAVVFANGSDLKEIRVANGTYSLAVNLLISENVTIRGGYESNDWNFRNYQDPDARNGSQCNIQIAGGISGSPTEHQGSIIFDGSGIGSNTVLEGLRIYAMGGAQDFTTAVSFINGASPTIQYCDLFGASISEGSALFVKDSSPSIFSSQVLGDAANYSTGLLVSDNGNPLVISSRISATQVGNPATGIGLQLEGSDPGGRFYNNYIEGKASTQAAAVRLMSSGGSFINNIFNVESGMPADICFWEDSAGMRPERLQNNNFSTDNIGNPLYMRDGSIIIDNAGDINNLPYASSSANSGYRIIGYADYILDGFSQYLPSAVAYEGQSLSSLWPYDIYNNPRSNSGGNGWSRGALELDYTNLGDKYLNVNDTGSDNYDGVWRNLTLREALHLSNTQEESDTIIIPTEVTPLALSEPLIITSSVFITSPDSSLVLLGPTIPTADRHIVIDDDQGSTHFDVFIRGITFRDGSSPVEGGSIFNLESLFLYDCQFDDNDAPRGGAVYTREGLLYIANTVFTLNEATQEHGGGIYVLDSIFNGHNLVFSLNLTSGPTFSVGSSIYAEDSQATVSFSTFYDNEAMNEAAVYGKNSDLRVLSSIFNSNVNTVAGPPDETDAYIDGGSLDLKGSIAETDGYNNPPDVTILAPAFSGPGLLKGADNTWMTTDDGLTAAGSGDTMVNHGFEDAIPVDWADADGDGNTSEPFPYDIKKEPRIFDSEPDAGAYEIQSL
jgi:Protein of unknown function (DUF1565)